MRETTIMAAVVLAFLASAPAHAQLYQWTDPSGRVHFTDTPPPANARNVKRKKGGPAPSASSTPSEPYAVQQARSSSPVTLYTGPGCDPCAKARKLLNDRGVPFKEVSVADEAAAGELKRATGGTIVPSIAVGAGSQMGFEEGAYSLLLDKAGYPKTGILPAKKEAAASQAKITPPAPPVPAAAPR